MKDSLNLSFSIELDKARKAIPQLLESLEDFIKVDVTQEIINACAAVNVISQMEEYTQALNEPFDTLISTAEDTVEVECYEAMRVFVTKATALTVSRISDPQALTKQIYDIYDTIMQAYKRNIYPTPVVLHASIGLVDKYLKVHFTIQDSKNKLWYGFELADTIEYSELLEYISKNLSEEQNIFWKMVAKTFPSVKHYVNIKASKDFIAKGLLSYGATDVVVM